MSSKGGAQDGEVYIITRDDLIAAFRLWHEGYILEPETTEQALARMRAPDMPTACADTLIAFLEEAAMEPDNTRDT